MVKKVCLDSDILIDLLKGKEQTKQLIEALDDAIFYTTAISVFEVWFGRKTGEKVFEFIESLEIVDLSKDSAKLTADIKRELKKKGKLIDLRDMFISAICIENDLELLTYNKKHFERIKSFGLILV